MARPSDEIVAAPGGTPYVGAQREADLLTAARGGPVKTATGGKMSLERARALLGQNTAETPEEYRSRRAIEDAMVPPPPPPPSSLADNYDPAVRVGVRQVANFFGGDPVAASQVAADAAALPASPGMLAGVEQEAADQAAREGGAGVAKGASPEQTRLAVLQALSGLGPKVVGHTKAGFQPKARGEQVQVESKVPGPQWNEALARFTETGKAASEGEAAVATEMQLLAQAAAERESQQKAEAIQGEQIAVANEERFRQAAEQRVQAAIQAFEASAPKAENYGSLLAGRSDEERMGAVVGALLGIFGGGPTNAFADQLDKSIERRARAAEQAAQIKGQAVGMQENAYQRLVQSLGDARAARTMLRGLYAEQAKSELQAAAARIGVGSEHPKLQRALQELEAQRLGFLKETASIVTQNARSEDQFVPSKPVVAGGAGKLGVQGLESLLQKDQLEALGKFEQELEKRGVHQAEQGVELMREGLNDMKRENPDEGRRFLLRLAASRPGDFGELFGQVSSSPGSQKFLEGYQRIRQADAGKALTGNELVSSANALGAADDQALETSLYVFNRRIQDQYNGLRAGPYAEAFKLYQLKKAYNASEGRTGGDIRGTASPMPQTEGLPIAR